MAGKFSAEELASNRRILMALQEPAEDELKILFTEYLLDGVVVATGDRCDQDKSPVYKIMDETYPSREFCGLTIHPAISRYKEWKKVKERKKS